jgi:hypothetical protein
MMSRNLSIEEVRASSFLSHNPCLTFFPLLQRQAAQEAQDKELDERRLQGIAVVSQYLSLDSSALILFNS